MKSSDAQKQNFSRATSWKLVIEQFRILRTLVLLLLLIPMLTACSSDSMDVELPTESMSLLQNGSGSGQYSDSNSEVEESITAILLDNGLTELVEALDYVNAEIYTQLVELFASQNERHTVFAPSNEAFFKLYDCLGMKTQNISEIGDPGLVRDILLYHVVKGMNDSDDIIPSENETEIETLYGRTLTIKSDRSIQSVGSIAFIGLNDADKKAKNGIVHVISEVLLPVELSCQ